MTPLQVATLLLRLAAIVWALLAIEHVSLLMLRLRADPFTSVSVAGFWFYAALHFGACAVLWFFPATVARKLLPSLQDAPGPTSAGSGPSAVQWQTIGFVCVGLLAMTRAVPDLLNTVTFAALSTAFDSPGLSLADKVGSLRAFVELIIGLWLILGARGMAETLFKPRAGIARERTETDGAGR